MGEKGEDMNGGGANEELVRNLVRHQSMLMEYITALVRNAADAEDVYQELSVQVLCNPGGPSHEEKFGAWCRGIARNLALHHWRSKRGELTTVDAKIIENIDCAFVEADGASDSWAERRGHLRDCIRRLPGPSQTVLKKRYWENVKATDMARQLKCSAESVRMKLMRARDLLRDCVGKKLLLGRH